MKWLLFGLFAALFLAVECDVLLTDAVPNAEAESSFESSEEFFEALRANSMSEFKLNNESRTVEPTNVTLSMTNRTLKCSINNLIPNNGYMVNFYRNDVAFAFYRVRTYDVIWSTMNLNTILDFYPAKGSQNAYPNFTVDISADSQIYGDYQCTVKILGILKDDNDIVFNSNHVVLIKEKKLTPELRWNKVFPKVNVTFSFDNTNYTENSIHEAKCKVRFDRPISEYIVYFLNNDKVLGAYIVQTEPKKVKWQLFPRNLLESKHFILELEEESAYPAYSILVKPSLKSHLKFSCKIEIPSKKHPIGYYSNEEFIDFNSTTPPLRVTIKYSRLSDRKHRCYILFNFVQTKFYTLKLVNSRGSTIESRTISESGNHDFDRSDSYYHNDDLSCALEINGREYTESYP